MPAFNIKSPWDELPDATDFMTPIAPNTRTTTGQDAAFRQNQISAQSSPQANQQRMAPAQGAIGTTKVQQPIMNATPGWTSGLGPLGRRNAALDEGAFFNALGTIGGGGFEPGGVTGGFLAEEFNPRFLAAANTPYGGHGQTYGEGIMAQSGIMNQLMGKGVELDPAAIVANTIGALASIRSVNDLENINPALAAILNQAATDPTSQLQALTSFLGQALAGSMPEDLLRSWLMTIQRVGQGFNAKMDQMDLTGKGGGQFDIASLARYLAQQLGPTLGI